MARRRVQSFVVLDVAQLSLVQYASKSTLLGSGSTEEGLRKSSYLVTLMCQRLLYALADSEGDDDGCVDGRIEGCEEGLEGCEEGWFDG
jgi:hypothetical protein